MIERLNSAFAAIIMTHRKTASDLRRMKYSEAARAGFKIRVTASTPLIHTISSCAVLFRSPSLLNLPAALTQSAEVSSRGYLDYQPETSQVFSQRHRIQRVKSNSHKYSNRDRPSRLCLFPHLSLPLSPRCRFRRFWKAPLLIKPNVCLKLFPTMDGRSQGQLPAHS